LLYAICHIMPNAISGWDFKLEKKGIAGAGLKE
jgi:hypothetical protein